MGAEAKGAKSAALHETLSHVQTRLPRSHSRKPKPHSKHSTSFPHTTMFARLSVLAGLFIAAVSASNVVELTPDNFDQIIGQGKPALVEL